MNIYLGNLNYGVKEQDLQTLLEGFGAIDSVKLSWIVNLVAQKVSALPRCLMTKLPNGRSKNCLVKNLPVVHWSLKEARPRA